MNRLRKYFKFALMGCMMAVGGFSASAETVAMKHAKLIAQNFFNAARGFVTAPVSYIYNGKDLTTQRLFTPFYVFNSPTGGFVIISADNKAYPVLGFSLTQKFDKNLLPESVKATLADFSHDIELIRYDSRIPSDAIEQWNEYKSTIANILADPSSNNFSAEVFDNGGNMWMAARYATEFEFEENPKVEEMPITRSAEEEISIPEAPVVTSNVAGHFALSLPEEIRRVIVYNVAGAAVLHKTYKNTNTAHIDLAGEPNGFYVALIIDKNNVSHATKLFR